MKQIFIDEINYFQTINNNVSKYILDNKEALKGASEFSIGVNVLDYYSNNKLETKPYPVILKFKTIGFSNKDIFYIFIKNTISNKEYKITSKTHYVKVYNLIPHTIYSWYVCSADKKVKSNVGTFTIDDEYRLIYTKNSFNIRDIGGKRTLDNQFIRYGLVYRGPEFTRRSYSFDYKLENLIYSSTHTQIIKKNDLPFLYDLNFKVDLDLRAIEETNFIKSCPINDENHMIEYELCPILPYDYFFIKGMEEESTRKLYRKIFTLFSNADKRPIYIHCWGGADRTGTLCFILEAILGADISDLVIDYELTTFAQNICRTKPFEDDIDPFFRKTSNMYTMLTWLKSFAKPNEIIQETIVRYLIEIIKVPLTTITKIRNIFLIK